MSVVLDASATLAWVYPDEATPAIRDVFERISVDGCIVPALWPLEVGNSLMMALRRGRISASFRSEALRVLRLLPITVDDETNAHAWTTTLQLADRFGLSVYDAAYLDLAWRRGLPLASLDVELRNAAQALRLVLFGA